MKRLFIADDQRLNRFWRILLYTLLSFVVMAGAMMIGLGRGSRSDPTRTILYAALYIGGMAALTYLWRRYVDRRPWSGMGVTGRVGQSLLRWGGGYLSGVVMLAAVTGVAVLAGWIDLSEAWDSSTTMRSLVGGFFATLPVGFAEELMMRGYWLQNLGERFPVGVSAVVMGIAFGLLHFDAFGLNAPFVIFVLSALTISLFLAASRLLTGSLWFAMGWHAAWNWTQSYLFGFATASDLHPVFRLKRQASDLWLGGPGMPEEGLMVLVFIVVGLALQSW